MVYSFRKIQMALTLLMITATGFIQGSDILISRGRCGDGPRTPKFCCSLDFDFDICGDFFIAGEALYLRAYEGGLAGLCDNAQITDSFESDGVISKAVGKGREPNFKWNPGFRVGAGYEFGDTKCDIGAYWTHYYSKTGGRSPQWKLKFDVVDAVSSGRWDCSPYFVLSPFGGLRYARIHQTLHTHNITTINGDISDTARGHLKERFFGIGPLFGVEGDYGVGCGFSLYGNISVAILYGTFHNRSHEIARFDTGRNISHTHNHLQACQPVVDAGFGIRWRACFCNGIILTLQLGAEQHRYFNHNQLCSYGDLSLDGGSLAIGLEY